MIKVPDTVLTSLTASFGTTKPDLTYLGGGRSESDGIAYTYNRDGRDHVLKILAFSPTDPDALRRLEARLAFVHFLGERGAPIVAPLNLPEIGLYTTHEGEGHLFVAYTYRKIEGGVAGKVAWFDALAHPWGAAVGTLHRLARDYPTWQHSTENDTGRTVLGWQEEWQGFYDWCEDADVKARWLTIRDRLEALPVRRDSFGFIHNDPHAENILITESGIVLLDFDVANYHWFINDIAIALQALMFKKTGGLERPLANADPLRRFLEEFMQGYGMENSLDPFWIGQIDLFIAYRRILMFVVMQDWLSQKPSQRRIFKSLIMDEPPILA